MKDNRWLEIDGDLLEEALKDTNKRQLSYRKIFIAAVAALVSVCALAAVFVPLMAGLNDESGFENQYYSESSSENEESRPQIDIYEIVGNYPDAYAPWNNGEGLTVMTLSGEKDNGGSGSASKDGNGSEQNEAINLIITSLPNVKLESYTAGRYIDMTGNGVGRYDDYQEARGIYRDIITGEFFCLEDEIKKAALGDEYERVYHEFLINCAKTFGFFKFSDDPIEDDRIYESLLNGTATYEEVMEQADTIPENFGFTDEQEAVLKRYFDGEELNVGKAVFPNDSETQNSFSYYVKSYFHGTLRKHAGEVTILEFGVSESKCLYIRQRDDTTYSYNMPMIRELGIFDRSTKEITVIDIGEENVLGILWLGSQYTVNEDYNMFAYICTENGNLKLVDIVNGKIFSGAFDKEDLIVPEIVTEESVPEDFTEIESGLDERDDVLTVESEEPEGNGDESGEAGFYPKPDTGIIGKIRFSPDGGFVYSRLNTDIEGWLFLNTETGEDTVIEGSFVKFIAGGSAVIMETEGGIKLYDVSTGVEITHMIGNELQLQAHEIHFFYENENSQLVWRDIFDGEEKIIREGYDAFITDKNMGCVYVFTKSDLTVRGYSAANGECTYEAKISESFCNDAPDNAIFNLLLDSTETTLLISYYTPLSLEFDEGEFWKKHDNYWTVSGDIDSIPHYAYIYLRCIKYNGQYLDAYDSDDVNGQVTNIDMLGKYIMMDTILEMVSDDMLIDKEEYEEIGRIFTERIEQYIEIDSMGRVKVIDECLTEIFGYELNIGHDFIWGTYLPTIKPYSVEVGEEYIKNLVEVNVNTLSGGKDSEDLAEFIEETAKKLQQIYSKYLVTYDSGSKIYRMGYDVKMEIRDRIISEYKKQFD